MDGLRFCVRSSGRPPTLMLKVGPDPGSFDLSPTAVVRRNLGHFRGRKEMEIIILPKGLQVNSASKMLVDHYNNIRELRLEVYEVHSRTYGKVRDNQLKPLAKKLLKLLSQIPEKRMAVEVAGVSSMQPPEYLFKFSNVQWKAGFKMFGRKVT